MEDKETANNTGSFAHSVGFWVLSVAVGVVVVVAWEPIVYRLGAENLSANHPLAMGIAMFAVTLSNRVFRKGVAGIEWADVAQSIAIGAGIGAILTLM